MSFTDKVVLITGGSSGIGASAAVAFAAENAQLCIVGRNEERLAAVGEQCAAKGVIPLLIKADLSKDDEAEKVIQEVIDKYGRLDVLINNAGTIKMSKIGDEDHLSVYDYVMNINTRAAVLLTNLTAKYLKESKGNIVNIASAAAIMPFAKGYSAYCIGKAALVNYSRVCAMELAEFGIRVNSISPGPVQTPFLDGPDGAFDWEQMVCTTALRHVTKPEEIADLIVYMASDKAKSITGSDFVIDAGFIVNK